MLTLKRLGFAAAAITLGPAAFAAINSPTSGPSDVFLAVWNPNTNQSIVQDLGITEAQFEATDNNTQTYTIDGTASAFASALSTSGGTAGDLYIVFAGNANGAAAAGNFFDGTTLQFTGTSPPNSTFVQSNVQDAANAIGTFVNTQMVASNNPTVVASGATNPSYWAKGAPGPNPGLHLGGPNSFNVSGGLGTNLNYYNALNAGATDDAGELPTVSRITAAGFWNLSTGGTLTWNAATAQTPLPAAVWMFLSGLLGLGTVSRRKAV